MTISNDSLDPSEATTELSFGNTPERVFPGDHDVVHGQHLYRPDGNEIELYRFEIPDGPAGLFTAEIIAERLADSSLLDSYLTVYRENADGSRVRIAQNDDYFSEDSFIELELASGTYFVGVTSTGNENYNPHRVDSGAGGTSQGKYELRLNFRPDVSKSMMD